MEKQIIISIGREFGSEGHKVAEMVAERLQLKLYDRNFLEEVAQEKDMDIDHVEVHDEKPRNRLLSRRVGAHTNSIEAHVAQMQFDYMRKLADSGESFVIVGRCAETVLRDNENLLSIFILGDKEEKLKHVMEKYQLNEFDASIKIKRHDRKRKFYHNEYSDYKWGDSRGYDLCINSSKLHIDKVVDLIVYYVQHRTVDAENA